MPTLPLVDSSGGMGRQAEFATKAAQDSAGAGDGGATSPFTPLSLALQGTLQRSHLHIWTDMNVLLHRIPGPEILQQRAKGGKRKKNKDRKSGNSGDIKKQRGQILAGSAYSIPNVDGDGDDSAGNAAEDGPGSEASGVLDPWAAGQGVKVIRGEPLRFTFRVAWVQGEDVLAVVESSPTSGGAIFSSIFMFPMAVALGAVVALWLDKRYGRRRSGGGGWNGDGLLGHSSAGRITIGNPKGFGLGVKTNGYGGYSQAAGNGPSYGYGGYSGGKRD